MKKLVFEIIFKISILILASYFLFLIRDMKESFGIGRYQFKSDSNRILDTKTGKIYINRNGQLEEHN